MPNIAQVLKQEICRLAKKEAKALTGKLKKDVVRLKRSDVASRRNIKQLQRDNALLMNAEKRRQQNVPAAAPGKADKARITAKGVRAMRKKLGLSQALFAKLVKVTDMTIYNWEKKDGALRLRDNARAGILALRGVGAKEAKRRLEMLAEKGTGKKGKRTGRKAKGKRARK